MEYDTLRRFLKETETVVFAAAREPTHASTTLNLLPAKPTEPPKQGVEHATGFSASARPMVDVLGDDKSQLNMLLRARMSYDSETKYRMSAGITLQSYDKNGELAPHLARIDMHVLGGQHAYVEHDRLSAVDMNYFMPPLHRINSLPAVIPGAMISVALGRGEYRVCIGSRGAWIDLQTGSPVCSRAG